LGVREKSHLEEWTGDERPRKMRESFGRFTGLLSVNECPILVSVDIATYSIHRLFR